MKRNTNNSVISRIMNRIDPVSMAQTSTKMHIACLIDDAMKEQSITKEMFAEDFKTDVETVEYWLSGTYNFTVDNLVSFGLYFGLDLVTMYKD
jgi:hypothetical protein